MPNYTAPLDDMMFLFDKLRNNQNYNEIEKYKEVNTELCLLYTSPSPRD